MIVWSQSYIVLVVPSSLRKISLYNRFWVDNCNKFRTKQWKIGSALVCDTQDTSSPFYCLKNNNRFGFSSIFNLWKISQTFTYQLLSLVLLEGRCKFIAQFQPHWIPIFPQFIQCLTYSPYQFPFLVIVCYLSTSNSSNFSRFSSCDIQLPDWHRFSILVLPYFHLPY